jgi:hypothetical protein
MGYRRFAKAGARDAIHGEHVVGKDSKRFFPHPLTSESVKKLVYDSGARLDIKLVSGRFVQDERAVAVTAGFPG